MKDKVLIKSFPSGITIYLDNEVSFDELLTDIAYKCGFNDVNYFSRFFKKHTGISPSKYTTL